MKKKKTHRTGFSVMEIVVSFVVIAVITGVATPIFFKKSSKMKLKNFNKISTNCDTTNQTCANFQDRCQIFKKQIVEGETIYNCIVCKASVVNNCKSANQYFDKTSCSCGECLEFDTTECPECCSRCNSRFCTGCALGVGLKTRSAKMGCEICPEGTYSDTTKDEPCKPCEIGFYQPSVKQTNKNSCKKCEPGHYCDTKGLPDQKDCKKGTYQDKYQQSECKDCEPGHKCPNTKMKTMEACGIGNFQPAKGQTDCISCQTVLKNSTTTTQYASSSAECVCPEGKYIILGTPLNYCGTCTAGTHKVLVTGSTYRCDPCPAGYRCPGDGSKQKCNCGTYAPVGSDSCFESGSGHFTPLTDGVYKSKQQCPAGTYAKDNKNCSCVGPCSSGEYTTAATSCTTRTCACKACNEQFKNCEKCENNKCAKCKKGFYLKNETCVSDCMKFGSNCATCDNSQCLTCVSGYGKSEASSKTNNACYCKLVTQEQIDKCNKPDDNESFYIKSDDIEGQIGCKGLCVKKKNAGDLAHYIKNKPDIEAAGVEVFDANDESGRNLGRCAMDSDANDYACVPPDKYKNWLPTSYDLFNSYLNGSRTVSSAHKMVLQPACWYARSNGKNLYPTANDPINRSGYNPQYRTVCNYYAAELLCNKMKKDDSGHDWRLPTRDELVYFYNTFAVTKLLNPCYENEVSGFDRCTPLAYACYGAKSVSDWDVCHPHGIWGQNGIAYLTRSENTSSVGKNPDIRFAFSTRCVYSIEGK